MGSVRLRFAVLVWATQFVVMGGCTNALASLLCIGLFLRAATAQERPLTLQPTPLEAFAGLPATHVAWSKEVGRMESSDAMRDSAQ